MEVSPTGEVLGYFQGRGHWHTAHIIMRSQVAAASVLSRGVWCRLQISSWMVWRTNLRQHHRGQPWHGHQKGYRGGRWLPQNQNSQGQGSPQKCLRWSAWEPAHPTCMFIKVSPAQGTPELHASPMRHKWQLPTWWNGQSNHSLQLLSFSSFFLFNCYLSAWFVNHGKAKKSCYLM